MTIYEVPDQATVEALLLAIGASGQLEKLLTTELHPVGVAMEGMRSASEQSYRGPIPGVWSMPS